MQSRLHSRAVIGAPDLMVRSNRKRRIDSGSLSINNWSIVCIDLHFFNASDDETEDPKTIKPIWVGLYNCYSITGKSGGGKKIFEV